MTREEAIEILDPKTQLQAAAKYRVDEYLAKATEACRMGADALRAQDEAAGEGEEPLQGV